MIICGIELKANNIIFSVVDKNDEQINYIDTKIKKLSLEDDESQESIIDFKNKIDNFITSNNIEKVVIKKRAKKGNFAGGAITFKIESIIQLTTNCKVEFISSQAISKYTKNNDITFPSNLNKYQEQAYISSLI